jgi:cysteine desulfurase family protein
MIYLDSAATTLQKPPSVPERVKWAVEHLSSPGRGSHEAALMAAETAFSCREAAAKLFNVENVENIIFTFNATHALNLAIKSIVNPGDKVLISGYEHNSVSRPLKTSGAEVVVCASALFDPDGAVRAFEEKLRGGGIKLVAVNHVSNVFGYIQPVYEIAKLCRRAGVRLIVDAAQSAGSVDVDFAALGADFIAMPGHKGLYGPQGVGLLICNCETPRTLLEGGTGSNSLSADMPDFLPDRLEAGTHNMPGIAGLLAGIEFVQKMGVSNILKKESDLIRMLNKGLAEMDVKTFYDATETCQAGVLSFIHDTIPCDEFASEYFKRHVAVRTGYHCSPLAHASAGTIDTGTVRLSVSAFSTKSDIYEFLNVTEEIIKKK